MWMLAQRRDASLDTGVHRSASGRGGPALPEISELPEVPERVSTLRLDHRNASVRCGVRTAREGFSLGAHYCHNEVTSASAMIHSAHDARKSSLIANCQRKVSARHECAARCRAWYMRNRFRLHRIASHSMTRMQNMRSRQEMSTRVARLSSSFEWPAACADVWHQRFGFFATSASAHSAQHRTLATQIELPHTRCD